MITAMNSNNGMYRVFVVSDVQKYFKSVDAGTSVVPAAATVTAVSPLTAVSPVAGLTELQQQMVQQFSAHSSMNAAWSARYGSSYATHRRRADTRDFDLSLNPYTVQTLNSSAALT